MSSKRNAIVTAMVTALEVAGGPAGLNVHRQRARPIQNDRLPAQVVYLVEEDVDTGPGNARGPDATATRSVTVRVETRIDAGDVDPDEAVDPYLTWAVKQLCGDPTLGGTAFDLVEQKTEWAAMEADKTYAAAQTDFLIRYFTNAADPTANP